MKASIVAKLNRLVERLEEVTQLLASETATQNMEQYRRLTREHCDYLVRLPMAGSVSSLNVSVATGVCLFEALRQRGAKAKTSSKKK